MRILHLHNYRVTGVQHRDRPWLETVNAPLVTRDCTTICKVCDCGRVKTEVVDGTWTLEQVKGRAH